MSRWSPCLVAVLLVACKGDAKDPAKPPDPKPATGQGLDQRCVQLGKVCGDTDKHIAKIIEGCKEVAAKHTAKSCDDKATALYDCYERELCLKADKVWAFQDLHVLAARKNACAAERTGSTGCVEN